MANTNYGTISQRTAAWAATEMLSHAEPILVLSKFGQSKPLPSNKADTVKFRRPKPFAISLTPLTEGATPASQQMAYEDVTVQIAQYGAVIAITDKVDDLAEDPVLKDAAMMAGEQAAETVEMITYGAVKAGTNVFYDVLGNTSRAQVATAVSIGRIRAVVRSLRNNRGKPVTSMLSPSPGYATKAIEGGYIAFGHTDLEADIRGLAGFTPVASYGSRQPLCPEELGSVESIRFILTPLMAPIASSGVVIATAPTMLTSGTNIDVYPLIVIAKEAYGLVPLKGANSITPSVLNPGTPTKSDPLGQIGFVGWKTYFAAKILNENWIARLEVAATKL